ncbi:MAG: pyridoxal-dependent decarboxylase [Thermoleophilaceae bacterium]
MTDSGDGLERAAARAAEFRRKVFDRPVAPPVDPEALSAALGGALPEEGASPDAVIDQLVAAVEPALVATAGPRYFGFVVGGALESSVRADILTSGWDQMAFNAVSSPAAAAAEAVVGEWARDLLGLPADSSFGLTTGAQGANTVALAAARHRVLAEAGWDVEENGLTGAPPVRVLAGEERHATIDRSLRLLGMGASALEPVGADSNGAMDPEALAAALGRGAGRPTIVCAQAGNVNTGACDDLAATTAHAREHGAWVHVDGAFGLWAAASPGKRDLVDGIETAQSWAVDAHKWLNVTYDAGFVLCADRDAHAASMAYTAAYLVGTEAGSWAVESSRRARGFASWAALRELGRSGVAELVDRCCALAERFAERLAELDGVEIGNEVVLNQVLASFGSDERTDRLIEEAQRDGTFWAGGTTWHGKRYMRISVSNWSTTEADVDRCVETIERLLAQIRAAV